MESIEDRADRESARTAREEDAANNGAGRVSFEEARTQVEAAKAEAAA